MEGIEHFTVQPVIETWDGQAKEAVNPKIPLGDWAWSFMESATEWFPQGAGSWCL